QGHSYTRTDMDYKYAKLQRGA
ncbi:hypothetical protein CCACVL1_00855, partial [Corchorus capsularis]